MVAETEVAFHIKNYEEGPNFTYSIVDSSTNSRWAFASAIVVDKHYVLFNTNWNGMNLCIFGVEEEGNVERAKRRVEERAKGLLEELLEKKEVS